MLAPAPRPWWAPRAAAHSSASHPAVYSPLQVAAGWLPFLDYSPATERLLRLLHAGVGVAILGGGNWAVLLGLARYRHLTGARLLVRPPLLHRHLTGQSLQPHRLCTLERGARVHTLFPSCIPKPSGAESGAPSPGKKGADRGLGRQAADPAGATSNCLVVGGGEAAGQAKSPLALCSCSYRVPPSPPAAVLQPLVVGQGATLCVMALLYVLAGLGARCGPRRARSRLSPGHAPRHLRPWVPPQMEGPFKQQVGSPQTRLALTSGVRRREYRTVR